MILSFTAIDSKANFREFCCQLTDVEDALNLLSDISVKGSKLISAHILDEGGRMELPVEVFDGQSFSDSIQKLREQWQEALQEPVRSALPHTSWRIELTQQQLRLYSHKIAQLTKAIDKFEFFRHQVATRTNSEPLKSALTVRYVELLNKYYHYLDRAKINQQLLQKKLTQLECH